MKGEKNTLYSKSKGGYFMRFPIYSLYYFSRLKKEEQALYMRIRNGWLCYQTKITLSADEIPKDFSFSRIRDAVLSDTPELFYISHVQYVRQFASGCLEIKTELLYSVKEIQRKKEKIDRIIRGILTRKPDEMTAENAAQLFFTQNTEYSYDFEDAEIYSPVGVFLNHRAVCDGYARAMKLVCDYAKVPCIYVAGTGNPDSETQEAHAWNIIRARNGNYYHVDATWNSHFFKSKMLPLYFKVSDTFIEADHVWDRAFYPQCSVKGKVEQQMVSVANEEEIKKCIIKALKRRKTWLSLASKKIFDTSDEIMDLVSEACSKVACSVSVQLSYNNRNRCINLHFCYTN